MKSVKLLLALLLAMGALSACSGAGNESVVNVGTMGTYFPFSYTDEEGNLTGYDVEVVRLLDEKMEDVTVEFVTNPLDSLFLDMDSERTIMVANQISRTPEREEKYLFSDDGYIYVQTKLVVHADDNTHTELADFEGETLGGLTSDYFTDLMETFNNENGNPYTIQYYDGEYTPIFMDLDAGRVQGTLNDTAVVSYTATNLGLKIKTVGDIIEESYSYFCIRNDEEGQAFKAKIDQALQEARDDGSLAALSMEWFGQDLTQ